MKRDWSVSLGGGGVAQGQYPAKYTFFTTQAPSCTADFAVYPINASTGFTRANLVGTFSTSQPSANGGTIQLTIGSNTLTLTASTTLNTGLNFQVFTTASAANATTEATNLAAAVNRNNSTVRVVARTNGANSVTVYALTPGSGVTLTFGTSVANFAFGGSTVGTNGSQANIVGFNNLYSGSTVIGTSNLCSGSYPAFIFSYASGASAVSTSPAISESGTKIAYVENDSTVGAIFHVLTFGSGSTEYGSCTVGGGSTAPTCSIHPVAPGVSTSTATDFMVPLGTAVSPSASGITDTISSPFIDYADDIAYVGDDNGTLYKITGTFRGTPTLTTTLAVSAGHKLTSPVRDGTTGDIFVGDSTGVLWLIENNGTTVGQTLTVGSTTASGIVDGPIVDTTNAVGYAAAGCFGGNNSQLVQFGFTATTLTSLSAAQLSLEGCSGSGVPLYDPAPDNNYFTKGISSSTPGNNGELIECATHSTTALGTELHQFQFTSGTMGSSAQFSDPVVTGSAAVGLTCSPVTEFDNTTTSTDWLFVGLSNGNIYSYTLPLTSNTQAASHSAAESGGTSGIIVDNVGPTSSGNGQTASIYFGTLTGNTAVKLTQAQLQ